MPAPYTHCVDPVILRYYYKSLLPTWLPARFVKAMLDTLVKRAVRRGGSRSLILPYLEICITPRCNLKCRHCANFMQLYDQAEDYPADTVLNAFSKFLDGIDYLAKLRILGGEPLLHKGLAEIVDFCGKHRKIGRIIVVSNGSLTPDGDIIRALRNAGAQVHISNYERTRKRREEVTEVLRTNGIHVLFTKNQQWKDYGRGEHFAYSPDKVRAVFKKCPIHCKTLVGEEFHICPRSAHGTILGFIHKREEDYLNVHALSTKELTRRIIRLYNTDHVEACYHCNDKAHALLLPPGEQ